MLLHCIRQIRLEHHHRAVIARRTAVIAGREDGDEAAIVPVFEATQVLRHLVRADDEGQAVDAQEPLGDIGPEPHAIGPTVRRARHPRLVLRVGPHEVEHQRVFDCVRRRGALAPPVDRPQMLDLDTLATSKTTMHNNNTSSNHRRQRELLEELLKHHKQSRAVFCNDFVVEPAAIVGGTAVHLEVLVVAAVDCHLARIEEHVEEDNDEDLARVFTTVGNITIQEIGRVGRGFAVLFQNP
mmetsp:Transcript_41506/g.111166  ORF Transcript_41506/g.111166 Transcript_41506/m.111166 type:complete len:240 (+) Transcript_41506:1305-2024(+)